MQHTPKPLCEYGTDGDGMYPDSMQKDIHTRAFRGELGTNEPNDESAIELLRSIL